MKKIYIFFNSKIYSKLVHTFAFVHKRNVNPIVQPLYDILDNINADDT